MAYQLPPGVGATFTKTLHSTPPAALAPSQQTLPSPFVAVVTGASRGIGAATARGLAQAGASGLVITARTAAALEETARACRAAAKHPALKVTAVAVDAASEAAAQTIAATIRTEHGGRLDLLINNAGFVSTHASAFETELHHVQTEQIVDTMAVNYVGRFMLIKHLMPLLLSSADGAKTIVNLSSVGAHFAARGAIGFNVSELASNRLIEAVAARYKAHGVRAFAIHPGVVRTSAPPGMPRAILDASVDDPALLVSMVLWLVREKCEWLSGRYLSANWDVEELQAMREEIVNGDKLVFRMVE